MRFFSLIIILCLFQPALATSMASAPKKIIKKSLQATIAAKSKTNAILAKSHRLEKSSDVIKIDLQDVKSDSDEPNLPIPGTELKPIKYTLGKFKLTREYMEINDSDPGFDFKVETICEGGIAVPTFDTRNISDDYYFSFDQTLSCTGILDGQFVRYFIFGNIVYTNDDVFSNNGKGPDIKVFIGGFYADPIFIGNPGEQTLNAAELSAAGTKDMSLTNMIISATRSVAVSACAISEKPDNANDPTDPTPIDPPKCEIEPIKDSVNLILEMNDN